MLFERGWPSFVIPAIATERRRYALGGGKYHIRKPSELLQPGRDRLEDYEKLLAIPGKGA